MTGNSFIWNRSRMWLGRWTFLALYLSLSSDLIKLLFPFLSVAHFFTLPPEGNPVQCLKSPVGHREKSKVNTLSRASKKTRDWELSSESTCSRKSTNRSTAHYLSSPSNKTSLFWEYRKVQWVYNLNDYKRVIFSLWMIKRNSSDLIKKGTLEYFQVFNLIKGK